jgi:hypothetical protein
MHYHPDAREDCCVVALPRPGYSGTSFQADREAEGPDEEEAEVREGFQETEPMIDYDDEDDTQEILDAAIHAERHTYPVKRANSESSVDPRMSAPPRIDPKREAKANPFLDRPDADQG